MGVTGLTAPEIHGIQMGRQCHQALPTSGAPILAPMGSDL